MNDYLTGIIKTLEFNKKTTIISDGKKYISKGGLPKEEVAFYRKRKNNAVITEVLNSPYEKTSVCGAEKRCGGCYFAEIGYDDEAKIKSDEINRMFAEVAERDGTEILPLHTPKTARKYRNKMEYTFGNEVKGGDLRLGLHEKNMFHNIVECENCILVPDDMTTIRREIRKYFEEKNFSFFYKNTKTGFLRHCVIRHSVADDEYLINIITTSAQTLPEDFVRKMLAVNEKINGKIVSIYHTLNDSVSDAVINEKLTLLYGRESLNEELNGLKFNVGPFSFFQTNTEAAEELYSYVKENMDEVDTLWDLYAGSAVIGQILSDSAKKVISVEINPENIKDARDTILRNGIKNVKVIERDCKQFVKETDEKADLIVIDPPRAGIHKDVVKALDLSGVKKIIYVSCNPVTLKNDLLAFENYRVKSIKCFDNFAGTLNIETVAVLENKSFKKEKV
ncbi:MAG: 23S rRNA (uracil(1939)-C(5))-methyltransferase RlmD [Firmicutes bacterium]|nr:23S rRNA (uracil(1939)-C(5))-methyltransferase RlmD [Bacillota bacterium]